MCINKERNFEFAMLITTTTIHTSEWKCAKDFSTEKQRYFISYDGRIIGELITPKGNEYYLCSDAQMRYKTLGEYIGCTRVKNDVKPRTMVVDHEKETEFSFTIDQEKFLK